MIAYSIHALTMQVTNHHSRPHSVPVPISLGRRRPPGPAVRRDEGSSMIFFSFSNLFIFVGSNLHRAQAAHGAGYVCA